MLHTRTICIVVIRLKTGFYSETFKTKNGIINEIHIKFHMDYFVNRSIDTEAGKLVSKNIF